MSRGEFYFQSRVVLAGEAPGLVFRCFNPSASRFEVLHIEREYSSCLGCSNCLFALLLPLQSSETNINKTILSQTIASLWIFYVLCIILGWLCVKMPVDQQFSKTLPTAAKCSKLLILFFFLILMFSLNFTKSSLLHLSSQLLQFNCLIHSLCYQATEPMYLVKLLVNVRMLYMDLHNAEVYKNMVLL